jgi:uncharacterized protein involved in exopolysaccharide biosynthesis
MTWRAHIAAVLGAVFVLGVAIAIVATPIFAGLSRLDLETGFSITIPKTVPITK